jgi:DNA ligase-1
MTTLYKQDTSGSLRIWSIEYIAPVTIEVKWGVKDGAMQTKTEKVVINMSGRNHLEQAQLMINAKINRQFDKGYKCTMHEALNSIGTNASELFKPMLAKVYNNDLINTKDIMRQYKYDGHRCMVTCKNGKVFAYSRNGKTINTIDHILKHMVIPEGITVDGELYVHDMSLQEISSLVRRIQPDNAKLKYIVYDMISPKTFMHRLDILHSMALGPKAIIALTEKPNSVDDFSAEGIQDIAINKGYEGLMLRKDISGYEPGVRSQQLLKCKLWLDSEYKVLAIHASRDGWAILECMGDKGKTFRVSAPGSVEDKTHILNNAVQYVGRHVNVKYAEVTNDGIPFHPVATRFINLF